MPLATGRARPDRRRAAAEDRPPSRGQRALWLLERMAPAAGAYRIAAAGRVVAGLDREALARALAAVVERHDALRTVFPQVGGEPVRRVLDRIEVPVEEVDGSGWSAPELERRLSEAAHRPFDLERGPLLRVVLFRRGSGSAAEEDRLVFVVHHLVADLWSLAIVLGELGELLAGRAPAGEAPSYDELVSGQEEYLADERAEADWRWWREGLAGRPPALDLPADRPRPPVQSFRGGARRLRVPARTWSRLRRLGRKHQAPPLVVLFAALDALLRRYTGQDDLVLGTPTAGRRSGRLAGVVGYCVNPVPVRTGLAGDPRFEEAVDRARDAALAAFEHQDLPFPVLVERLDRDGAGERDASRSPLFQVMAGLQRARLGVDAGMAGFALGVPGATLRLGPLELESVALEPRGSQFDLTVMTGEVDGALHGTLTYAADLFDATTVERWARHLERLLEEVAEHPERRLSELAPLAPAERLQMLVEWNEGAPARAQDRPPATLAEAFARAAAAAPDAVALVAGERSLSYAALAARASRLAGRLRELGVGPEARVAVLLRRREELVVALLGVLEAGGAYVPLDPAYPAERLGFMLADSGAAVVVTEPELLGRVDLGDSPARPRSVDPEGRPLQRGGDRAGAPRAPRSAAAAGPGNLAYLIYTSGSTGRPKAVAIEHRSALALVSWSQGTFDERDLSGVLAATSVCFDLSVFELFVTLCRGGRVFLVENALALAELGPAAAVTLVNTVPSAMEELARLGWLPPSVVTVNLAGEPLRRALVDAVYRRSAVARVLDLYGPSEDTTYSTGSLCAPPAGPGGEAPGEPAIGRPIAGTAAYLARDLRPVPLGVAGELLLGGDGLARGYLGRPGLTAERFVPDPFGAARGESGGRLYRTGDLARLDRRGELHYLGRLDHQAKIRGYRVEPGEIEALLARLPEVRETVVVARGEGDVRLVAYAALAEEVAPDDRAEASRRLRRHLASHLPAPLVPSALVLLDALPRTPNGKLDRRALPEPDWEAQGSGDAARVAPRTPVEAALAEIFQQVLGLERVGVEDGFFELGGHSLLVARVIAEVQERLGFELSLPLVFENPSIASLAATIEAAGGGLAAAPDGLAGGGGAADAATPLSFAQERLWILAQLDPRSRAYHLPGGVRMTGRFDPAAFAAAIGGIVARHDALRTVFRSTPAGPVQEVRPVDRRSHRRLPLVDLSGLPAPLREGAADDLSRREAERPFSLRDGPLVRVTLIRLAPAEHRAVVCMHHIVSDGWSIEVFVRELSELYAAAVEGRPAVLPALPVQYPEVARRQRRSLDGGSLDRMAAWWRDELAGAPAVLELPADRPRPTSGTGRAAELYRSLPARLRSEVERLARELDATPFMVWLAAFGALAGRLAGQDEVVVGSPTAGRHRAETAGLIGFFVNTLALRVDLGGDPTFGELVARVRARALGAYAHQELPFERVVEAVAPHHDPGVTPVFQVLFVLQNVPLEGFRLPGLALQRIHLPSPAAKFDLTVEVRELEGDALAARFEADLDRFDLATVERWAEHFETLVAAAVEGPERRLSELIALLPSPASDASGERAAPARQRPLLGEARPERAPEARERAPYVAPRDPVEQTLVEIFRDLLQLDRVGVDDRFFALGGHSLLAARLIGEVRERLGRELPLSVVLERPTAAGLAAALRERGIGTRIGTAETASPAEPIPRLPGDGPWPLSFAQERLWFLEQLEPGKPTYNMPAAVALHGRLDGGAMAAAVAASVRRHEALRTVFERVDGEPVQRVRPADEAGGGSPLGLALVDLAGLPPARRAAEARGVARREARRPFDLARGPLFRARLLRLSAEEHLFVLDVHHAVCDGWSLGIFVRELAALYEAAAAGRVDPLPRPPIRYGDFAAWQRDRLAGERLDELIAWWRRELEELPELSELPLDRPRPLSPSRSGAVHRRKLPRPLAERLGTLSRAHGATLFMTLLAAFQALVHRHTGATDFALGSPVAGRGRPETAGVIGLFVDTVVLRSDVAGDPSFLDLLKRARGRTASALAHQALPFDRLVQELAPRRDGSVPPLFQVMLALQNAPLGPLALPGVSMEPVELDSGSAKFDLAASFRPVAEGLESTWAFATELFDATTIARLAARFETILRSAAEAPERRLSELAVLSPAERHQVRFEWRSPSERYEAGEAIHRMLAARADEAPDAVALVMEGRALSLGELRRRWTAVAVRLRAAGVGPGNLVALFLDRSFDLVAGLVGILETGAAYVPVDPAYPPDRVAFMLADSDARAVVTQPDLVGALPPPEEGGPQMIVLDGEPRVSEEAVRSAPVTPIDPQQAAYVIYTSGSTGRPKGVVVGHRSLANRVAFHASEMKPGDRFLARTTISFDVAILQLVVPILAGGGAVLAPPALEQDAAALARLIEQGRVTHISLPPSLLTQLLAEPAFVRLRCLEHVFTGGEVVPPALADQFTSTFEVPLINRYGPTELTISITSWTCPPDFREPTLPIGRPIARAEIYLLDRGLRPVPTGVTGELHGGGVAVARGYLGRPAATAAAFVPDPFSGVAGARLYRTGDLARWRADGEIEFVGRRDEQVKVRGYRIELGEVEAALGRCPAIAEGVVAALPEPSTGTRQLVAYLVPAADAGTPAETVAAARAFLGDRLPAYMVPSSFSVLDALPQTPSGKVDRRALPAPDWQGAGEESYQPPRTPAEEIVASLFETVLGTSGGRRVGARGHFFDLGGHSLLATRLISRLRESLGVELPIRALFEHPTVEALAAAAEAARGGEPAPPLEPMPRPEPGAGGEPPAFAPSFAQERLWFLAQLDPDSPAYHLPGTVRMTGRLDLPALAGAVAGVADRHEALRTVFRAEGSGPVQVVQPPGWEALRRLPVVDLAGLPPAARGPAEAAAVRTETARPFDLEAGPLLRATLLRLASEEHVLVVNTHHIVSDGWSVGVFVRELSALYGAAVDGRAAELPALPVQYADYAAWQRRWLDGAALDRIAGWWRAELAGAPETLELPTDRPRPPVQTFRGGEVRRTYGEAAAAGVTRLARELEATPFMVWLSAVGVVLGRLAGQDDLVLGSPIAGRNRAETEGLVGFFVNTLALRVELGGDPSFRELVGRVRERALGAYAHQDLPFERLVETIAPRRDLATTPLFQVLFVLQNVPRERIELPGLALDRVETAAPAAKFALTVDLAERDDGSISARFERNLDLFDAATVRRWAAELERLVTAAVADPSRRVLELPLLAPPESHALLIEWSGAPGPRPAARPDEEESLAAAFRRSAAARPDAVAVVAGPRSLSYGGLARRARSLARRLRAAGVGPEVPVGVCAGRSADLVVALLAVLEAGGAYVPLDPAYPPERIRFMLDDSGARVVLADVDADAALGGEGRLVLPIDGVAGGSGPADDPAPDPAADDAAPVPGARHLAYVIYTSGSTGRPKGVAIPHGAARALVSWSETVYGPEDLDGVLAATSICFDLSIFELFVPLLRGGRVVLVADALAVADAPEAERATLLNTVPSVLSQVLALDGVPASVRVVNLAGEPLQRSLVDALERARPGVERVYDLYGPSEDTTYSTFALAGGAAGGAGAGEPRIGRPVDGTRAYVLDRHGRAAPVAVAGELCLAGAGLARGYLGRPARTAGSFVPDPFSEAPGERMYRTGDLARWGTDGRLEYLGRLDHQVKLRGYRIELGEVEAALLAHPEVREAAVVAHGTGTAAAALAAFVTASDADGLAARLRSALRERLPAYMVPETVRVVPALPLTPSGKIDRRALVAEPAEGLAGARRAAPSSAPPETAVEIALAEIFAEVLGRDGIEGIGIEDDFFDLGGHSLRATQVLLRVHDAFGVRVPVRRFFEEPTLAGLSVAVAEELFGGEALDEEALAALVDGEG